jgi:hypothetical protein
LLNEARTFAYVAEQWLNFKSAELVAKSVAGFRGALTNHVLPSLGKKPVTDIKLEHITTIITELRRKHTMAMARRVRTIIRAVLGFAEGRGWVERNVALSNIEELKIRHVVTSNPAIERPVDLGKFLLRLDDCNFGSVATAMRLLVMLPVRPGELANWRTGEDALGRRRPGRCRLALRGQQDQALGQEQAHRTVAGASPDPAARAAQDTRGRRGRQRLGIRIAGQSRSVG